MTQYPRLARAAATGAVGLVAGALYLIRRLRLRSEAIAGAALPGPRGAVGLDALPAAHVAALRALHGVDRPPGRFVRGRNGDVTHYILEDAEGAAAAAPRRVVVCAHGIGTSTEVFAGIVAPLLAAGFSVLRYDFPGHGWSWARDAHAPLCLNALVAQLDDLLDHVLDGEAAAAPPRYALHALVGHSTGGLLGVAASEALAPRRRLARLALVSPALWANKPLAARAADAFPRTFHAIVALVPGADALVRDAYLKNCDVAFGRCAVRRTYHFERAWAAAKAHNARVLDAHPQARATIASVSAHALRADRLPGYRDALARVGRGADADVLLLWGTLDVVVPFARARDAVALAPSRIRLHALEGLGHESLFEDPAAIAKALCEWL